MAARSTADVARIRDEVFMLEQERWITPDVNILKTRVQKTIGVEQIQQVLPESAAMLEYVVADPRSYCLVITRDSVRVVPLESAQRLRSGVSTYLTAIRRKKSAETQARDLYESILQPAGEALAKKTLVIVPDGPLHLVPFDSLMDRAGHFLVESHTVVYSPSATSYFLLAVDQSRRPRPARNLLGVGGIPYNPTEMAETTATRGYDVHALTNLPGSRDEVLAADAAFHDAGNTLLLGANATESAFKRAELSQYKLIHLAVHGLANTTDADRSALVLLSDPAAGEDGYLQASEIVQLKLNADLVVLSACDTDVGPIQGEEGIATLARSFLLAGAKAVVSTLWSVDDTFSLFLMKQFYRHIAERESPWSALADAKRDVLRRFGEQAAPYYWAAFTFEGAVDRPGAARATK